GGSPRTALSSGERIGHAVIAQREFSLSASVRISEDPGTKIFGEKVLVGPHGIFAFRPAPPDFGIPGHADHRMLAIGHWGTYKRLETLMDAFPEVLRKVPNARVVIAGANHHTKPGYWESVRELHKSNSRIDFLGYVDEDQIPDLFRSS